MSFLKLILLSTIAGTGLAIVRFFVSWCASCGGDDREASPTGEQDENSLETGHNNTEEVLNLHKSLNNPSMPLDEMKGHDERYPPEGNQKLGGSQSLLDEGILDANELSPLGGPSRLRNQEYPEKKVGSELLSNDDKTPDYSGLKDPNISKDENNDRDRRIPGHEPIHDVLHRVAIADGLGDSAYKTFPVDKSAIFDTDAITGMGLKESKRSRIKHLDDSGSSSRDILKIPSINKSPVKDMAARSHEYGMEKESTPSSIHKISNPESSTMQSRRLDTGNSFWDLSNTSQVTSPTLGGFMRFTNEELAAKTALPSIDAPQVTKGSTVGISGNQSDDKRSPRFSKISNLFGFTPDPTFQSSQQSKATLAPKFLATVLKNKKADKKGLSNALSRTSFDPIDFYLNPRPDSIGTAYHTSEKDDLTKVDRIVNPAYISSEKLLRGKGRPIPVPFPVPKTLDFTPDSLFRRPRPFGEASSIKASLIPTNFRSNKDTTASLTSRSINPGYVLSSDLMAAENLRFPTRPQTSMESNSISKQVPGLVASRERLPLFEARRVLTPRVKKTKAVLEKKMLDFTPDETFLNPRHFPQALPVLQKPLGNQLQATKVFEGFTAEDTDISDGKKRVLQDGSLETPLVGKVKLVSKLSGKDPGFTYATWAKAGSKRSRGTHNCQEKGGCRVCD